MPIPGTADWRIRANGLDALGDLPTGWWYEAVNACDDLGLTDLATLLRGRGS